MPEQFKELNADESTAAVQPRHPGHLPARLDLQGGDRGRGARHRRDHAGDDARRHSGIDVSGVPLANAGGAGLRHDRHRHGADQLGQHLLRPGRRAARRRRRCSSTWSASASSRSRRSTTRRTSSPRAASTTPTASSSRRDSTSAASRSARGRGGPAARDAAADGEVAAAVANGGTLMEPHIRAGGDRPRRPRRAEGLDPTEYSEVMSEETAAELAAMMTNVAEEGTGVRALGDRLDRRRQDRHRGDRRRRRADNQAWFIGFAPADDPQIAVAATVEVHRLLRRRHRRRSRVATRRDGGC